MHARARTLISRLLLAALPVFLLSGCDDNPCISLCQQYERWIDTCDTTWEARFSDRGWASVDDCYDTYWGADETEQETCQDETEAIWEETCY